MNCLKVAKWFPPCIVTGARGIFDHFTPWENVVFLTVQTWDEWDETLPRSGIGSPRDHDLFRDHWENFRCISGVSEIFWSSHCCDFQSCWGYLMCLIDQHFQNPGWWVIKKRASTGLWQQRLVCHQWPRRLDGTAQAEAVPNCMDFLQCFGGILLHMPFFARSMSKLPSSADRGSNGRISWRSQQSSLGCSEWRYGSMLVESGNCERWSELLSAN